MIYIYIYSFHLYITLLTSLITHPNISVFFCNCLNSGYTVTFYHKHTIENGYKSYIFIFQILSQGPIYKNKNRKEQSSHLHINFITNSQIIKSELKSHINNLVTRAIYHWVEMKHGLRVLSVFNNSCAYHAFNLTLKRRVTVLICSLNEKFCPVQCDILRRYVHGAQGSSFFLGGGTGITIL